MQPSSSPVSRFDRLRKWLDLFATLAVLTTSALFVWRIWPETPPPPVKLAIPKAPMSLAGVQAQGVPSAEVGLLMFMDFQCPFCRKFVQETLQELERQYVQKGVLKVALRHLPITQLHQGALALAEGTACVGRQGRFWEASAELFRAPKAEPSMLPALVTRLGLDGPAFSRCVAGEAVDEVRRDMALALDLGIKSTPSFFLGRIEGPSLRVTTTLIGSQPLVVFQKAIEDISRTAK